VDPEGDEFEVDLIARNGEWVVFEVKATGKLCEVSEFARKVRWLAAQNSDKKVRGILIALGADDETKALAEHHNLELVD
jgi:RecB family endonuclease NucS